MDEFVAITNAGSFVGRARTLGVFTAHVSRSIGRLEARVQTQILVRTTHTIWLTATRQTLLGHCRLVDEGFDLAVCTGTLADSRLIATRIASRNHYTCAALSYLERHDTPWNVADLVSDECLAGTAATWHFKLGEEEYFRSPRGLRLCKSGTAGVDAALAGMGICQLPEFYLLPPISTGELTPILADFRPAQELIWAVYPQRRHLMPKISRLVESLRARLPSAMGSSRDTLDMAKRVGG